MPMELTWTYLQSCCTGSHTSTIFLKKNSNFNHSTNNLQLVTSALSECWGTCEEWGILILIAPKYPLAGDWLMSHQVNRQPWTTYLMPIITQGMPVTNGYQQFTKFSYKQGSQVNFVTSQPFQMELT